VDVDFLCNTFKTATVGSRNTIKYTLSITILTVQQNSAGKTAGVGGGVCQAVQWQVYGTKFSSSEKVLHFEI